MAHTRMFEKINQRGILGNKESGNNHSRSGASRRDLIHILIKLHEAIPNGY